LCIAISTPWADCIRALARIEPADLVRAESLASRVLREPLLHVVVLGACLFALHRRVAPPRASQEIVVPADAIGGMRDDFRRRTGRMPSATDEKAMVDAWVNDEILVREALAMGLDRGDLVVRRRLAQKMEYLLENTDPVPAPTDAELEAFLRAHPQRYASPTRVSFTQVFVSAQRAGAGAAAEAEAVRTQLDGGADPSTLGDPFLRGRDFRLHSQGELAAIFGAPFAETVIKLPEGGWTAVRSTFGVHVVRVTQVQPGTEPVLTAVRERVERDWRAARRDALDREARERLRAQYVVRMEEAAS
jgi:hypothetical protein